MSKNIYEFYSGFYIDQPVGNNSFSYSKRKNKKIYVPKLISGNLSNLDIGKKIVFSEIENEIEQNKSGLKNFLYYKTGEKNFLIFDNHNHAFFFWLWAWKERIIKPGSQLVHIDQHSDMRKPGALFAGNIDESVNLEEAFNYTNYQLNVGNFIQPALDLKLFSSIEIVNSSESFRNPIPEHFILDIDMDIFAPELDYLDNQFKIAKIQSYIQKTSFITIATSPFFIDQQIAIHFIKELLL